MLDAVEDSLKEAAVVLPRHVGTGHSVQGASPGGFMAYETIAMVCLALVAVLFGEHAHLRTVKARLADC